MKKYMLWGLLALHAVLLVSSLAQKSMTRDEDETVAAGKEYWQTGSFARDFEQPPLVKVVVGLPQLLPFSYRTKLVLSRLPIVLCSLALAWLLYKYGKEWFTERVALFAVFLYALSPTILAHARLATFDLALTLFFFTSLYWWYKALITDEGKYAAYCGIFVGLAVLTKFTGLQLVIVVPTLGMLYWLRDAQEQSALEIGKKIAIVLGVGVGVVVLGYVGQWHLFVDGVQFQMEHAKQGNNAYLLGEYSFTGWWYYFPLVFFIKTPLAMIVLMVCTVFGYTKIPGKFRRNNWFLFLPVAYWWLFMMFVNNVNIGLRYMLPIYPLLFLLVAQVSEVKWRLSVKRYVGMVLATWYVAASVLIFPHYLAYFNELVGPKDAPKYVLDSNIDWGQDLKRVPAVLERHGAEDVHALLYGPENNRFRYPKITCERQTGWFVISVNELYGLQPGLNDCAKFLLNHEPVERLGWSVYVYRVSD